MSSINNNSNSTPSSTAENPHALGGATASGSGAPSSSAVNLDAMKAAAAALNLRPEDIASLMSQVTSLAAEKRQLEEKVNANEEIVKRFKAQEQAEMQRKFDEYIKQWAEETEWENPELKKKVMDGMKEIMDHTKNDSPIWRMVCCASETHKKNVTKLNAMTTEYNDLRSKIEGGSFKSEASRVAPSGSSDQSLLSGFKRKESDPSSSSSSSLSSYPSSGAGSSSGGGGGRGPSSIWDDFAASIQGGSSGINHFVPEPEVLRGLRSEWRPLGDSL